jgi:hypothetical protein
LPSHPISTSLLRGSLAEPIPGCDVRAWISWDQIGVGPPAKHRRHQATRFVATLQVSITRDGMETALATLPIEELAFPMAQIMDA